MKRPRFELSEALMMEILSKLPVKSLTRFSCVCKYWCSSFRTPHFVSKHYHYNHKNNNLNLLLQQRVAKTYTRVFSQLSTEKDEIFLIKQNIYLPFFKDDDILVYGACHGLLCIQNSFMDKVILWNTSTREFKILPPSLLPHPSFLSPSTNEFKILLPPRGYLTLQHVMYNDAAFGFDSETDNYKFIRFVTLNFYSEQEISDFRFASQVELYSLKSDSWKEISLPQPLEWGTYLDGIFFWKIMMREYPDDKDKDAIVSFDIANEKFSILLMSEFVGCYTEDPYRVKLLVFNGSLGTIVYPSTYIAIEPWIAPEKYFHFWVMNGGA
ncbi:hypothetical protein PVK06_036813 [Gossypium arboreum]|uniref:F-box domain-containing protein n=1 Tax=Gossypium arboreum TaxID=29729 RepID=A0ABR0NMU7_GOSAR|nr:hypothetical protein PVK06_036813 [Gossypium arboreum]